MTPALLIAWLVLIYALLVTLGGVMGYVKAGSKASLISGLISGIALLVAWWLSLRSPATGLPIASLFAFILTGVFVQRYRKTRKLVPAGVLSLVSLVAAILFAIGSTLAR